MARLLPTPRMIRGSCSCSPSLWLPSLLGDSRSQSIRCWAEHQMLELFSLQPRRWEGGPAGGCRVVVDNSGTTLCVPAEDSRSAVTEQQNFFQGSRTLTGYGGFCVENNSKT
jgi:hypothetical protein